MTIPSCLSSEMHLQKSLDQTEFQSWVVNFRAEVCAKAKNLALALQWIKKIEAASSLKDLIKINYEQRVLWFWRIGFDDGGRIETVLRKVSALPKEDPRRRAESSKGQPISQRESDCLFDLRNYRAWSRDKRKGAKLLHWAEDWSMFQAKDNWVLFKKRHL